MRYLFAFIALTIAIVIAPSSSVDAAASLPSVLAIDFGNDMMKGCLSNLNSNSIGQYLDVVINDQSNRRTPSIIGFDADDERIMGDAALTLVFRSPQRVLTQMKRLVGQLYTSSAVAEFRTHFPQLVLAADPVRDTVTFVVGKNTLSVETVIVMLLQLAKRQADTHIRTNSEIADIHATTAVVISVPESFTAAQRGLVGQLSSIAGLSTPIAMLNELTAVAIDYAVRNIPVGAAKVNIAFISIGAMGAHASLIEMDRSDASISLRVLRTESDPLVGGYNIDVAMRDELARRFDASFKLTGTPKSITLNVRAMAKLLRAARELKEQLSVSASMESVMEEIHNGKDFKTTMTIEEFTALSSPIVSRFLVPLRSLIAASSSVTISSVELFGGQTRTPSVQQAIRDEFPAIPVGKHVDTEESAVLGAAHYAGVINGNKKLLNIVVDESAVLPASSAEDAKLILTTEQIATLTASIAALDARAAARHAADAARNALESTLNDARDVLDKKSRDKKVNKALVEALESAISVGSAFVDDADKSTTTDAFDAQRVTLLAAITPLRPAVVAAPAADTKSSKSKPSPASKKKKPDRRAEHKRAQEEAERSKKKDEAKAKKQAEIKIQEEAMRKAKANAAPKKSSSRKDEL